MAFSAVTISLQEALAGNQEALVSAVAAGLSANAPMADLGGALALARGVVGFLHGYRNGHPQALSVLSASQVVSVAASATSSLLTMTIQLKPAA